MVIKIISGGQTGADRAALDFAILHGIPYGGWVPRGRRTEDGTLPEKYLLDEMPTPDYAKRTEQNVLDSDGTLIVSHGCLKGGSALTAFLAEKLGRPCIHVDLARMPVTDAAARVRGWLHDHRILVLNVAGPRAGTDPKIYRAAFSLLETMVAEFETSEPIAVPGGATDLQCEPNGERP